MRPSFGFPALGCFLAALLLCSSASAATISLRETSTESLVSRLDQLLESSSGDAQASSGAALAAREEQQRRLSSLFCAADTGTSYTDLLDAAQFAFKRRDYSTSRSCYGKALAKYWQEYDTNLRPGLLKATEENMERMNQEAKRMKSALQRMAAGGGGGGGGGAEEGASASTAGGRKAGLTGQEKKDLEELRRRERQHHLAGKHQAPPGARLASSSSFMELGSSDGGGDDQQLQLHREMASITQELLTRVESGAEATRTDSEGVATGGGSSGRRQQQVLRP